MAPKRWLVMRPIPVTWVSVQWQEGRSTLNRARRFSHLQFMTEAASMMRHLHLPELLTSAATWKEHKGFWLLASFNLCRSSSWLFILFNKNNICRSQQRMHWGRQLLEEMYNIWFKSFSQKLCLYLASNLQALPLHYGLWGSKKYKYDFYKNS